MEEVRDGIHKVRAFVSHRINSHSLKPGDHIYCYRVALTYSHHGIYIGKDKDGKDKVIHFIKTKAKKKRELKAPCPNCGYQKNVNLGVVKTCFDCFVKVDNPVAGHSLHLYEYGVSLEKKVKRPGSCTTLTPKTPEEVVNTATELHRNNGFGEYHLTSNNCEDFATFCKSGTRVCAQRDAVKATAKVVGGVFSFIRT